MMKKGKKLLTASGIFTGIFAVSFGSAFFSQYKPATKAPESTSSNEPTVKVETDQQHVLNSLLTISGFEVKGDMTMIAKDDTTIGVSLEAQGDLSNLEDIKIQGSVGVNLNDTVLNAHFGYFEEELYFDYNNSYFRLETTQLLDFIKMLPTNYDIGIELPTEIEEMDLSLIESYFENMSEKQLTPDGQNYYFTINLSEDVALYVVTDLDLNFAGLRTGTIDYNGMIFKLNVSLNKVDSVNLVNPKYTSDYEKYQDFSPALKLFDGLYNLTKQKQNTINADLKVRKYTNGVASDLLKTNLDFTYDLEGENHTFGLKGSVISNKADADNNYVEVPYSFALYEGSLYAHYGDIAFQVETDTLTGLIQYILDKIGDAKIAEIVSGLVNTLSTKDVTDIASKTDNLLGTIVLTGDELDINLNTSNFSTTKIDETTGQEVEDLTLSDLYVAIKFNSTTGALESVSIMNFGIKDYEADFVLTFGEYKPFTLDNVEYQKIDHLFTIAYLYDVYKDLNKFRIEFDATISKDDEEVEGKTVSYNDITVDGGLQFELDPLRGKEGHINVGYGYGELSITDRKSVKHNIKADMKNVNEILLSYSTVTGTARDASVDPMNVRMKVQTIKDLSSIISEIIQNPDDHMQEIMGNLLQKTGTLPIEDIIAGNYLDLLTTNLIDRFEVGPDYVELDVALDILDMTGSSFTVRVEFGLGEEGINSLKALKVSNFSYEGLNVEFNAYLKDFDESLESTRLPSAEVVDYIDFSDLKVLLQLGINTSKNNYYHFTASATVTFSIISKEIELPIDVKVWTDHGDVKVSVDIEVPNVKVLGISVNGKSSTDNRVAHIYYHDKMFYVHRTETYQSGILIRKTHDVEHVAKYNVNDFMDNILEILCGDVLCLSDTLMNEITKAVNKTAGDESYQMKYENILNDFLYSKTGHYFWFDINLAEIANNDQLKTFTVKVLTDDSDTQLTGLKANLSIVLAKVLGSEISIKISLTLTLADSALVADVSNNLTTLDAFESRMSGYESSYKNTTDVQR